MMMSASSGFAGRWGILSASRLLKNLGAANRACAGTLGQYRTILRTFGDETARKNENMGGTIDNQSHCSPMF
jgi:hypothetical protein